MAHPGLSVALVLVLRTVGTGGQKGWTPAATAGHSQCPVSSHSFPGKSRGAGQHPGASAVSSLGTWGQPHLEKEAEGQGVYKDPASEVVLPTKLAGILSCPASCHLPS